MFELHASHALQGLVLVSTGLSVFFAIAVLGRLLRAGRAAAPVRTEVPPPRLWRWLQPLSARLGAALEPILSARLCARIAQLLQQAGLDQSLAPAQVPVAALILGLSTAGLFLLLRILTPLDWPVPVLGLLCLATALLPWTDVQRRAQRRRLELLRAFPFFLDIVVLAVESGSNLTGALQHAVRRGPAGPLRAEVERLLTEIRTGRTRSEALRAWADRIDLPAVSASVAAMLLAERQGSPLGPVLRAQAEQRRTERFQLAEKRAMQAPVRMLLPLVLCIFPCTFLLLFFPVVVRLLEEGMLR